MTRIARCLCLLLILVTGSAAATSDLPTLGEPANRVLSLRQEAAIGRELMARARQQLNVNDDPEIGAYLSRLGHRLARNSRSQPVDGFTFFVVQDSAINAFAGPGGYIGVHSGLILEAQTEAELASVLAHEIGHVSQRHIARAYARNQRNSYQTLATVLAGLIIGAQNPEAGQAAITGGLAVQEQRRINYTRANEYEADRVGIGLLAQANFSPDGMTRFFEILTRSNSGSGVPAFLRTHPLSQTRVAEAASRARSLAAPGQTEDSLDFHLMKARIRVEYSDRPAALLDRWRQTDPGPSARERAARRYGIALLELQLNQIDSARKDLNALHEEQPDNLHYALALARAQSAPGAHDTAIATWRQAHGLHPDNYATIATGAELLLANQQADAAVELVTEYLRDHPDAPPEAWHQLAEAAEAAGRPSRSHEALGEYYVHVNRLDQALTQLNIALDRAAPETPAHVRLETRIEQVEDLRRERVANNPLGG